MAATYHSPPARRAARPSTPRQVAVRGGLALIAVVSAGFAINAAVRLPCHDVCGVDIARLYEERGIDRAHAPYFDRNLEYPPVIGLEMYAVTFLYDGALRLKFLLSALVLGGLAILTTWVLWQRFGKRTWRWALAPPLLLQGLTNWDLLSVAPATIGLLQWDAGRAFGAGVLLGIGAAAKLVPGLYVPLLALACVPTRMWKRAGAVIGGAVFGAGVFVIPVYALAPDALRHFFEFHRHRGPISSTPWYYLFRNLRMEQWLAEERMVAIVNIASPIVCGVLFVLIMLATMRGRISPIAACGLATIAFILANKIYSPQYDLWLVPFLVMMPVRTKLVVHFYAASTLVWVLNATEGHLFGRPASLYVLAAGAAYRFVVELLLAREFVRAGTAVTPAPSARRGRRTATTAC
jgi:hypothetical protein